MARRIALAAVVSAALALVAAPRPAAAGQRTNTLTVSATVLGMCTINSATLSFNSYDPSSDTALDAQAADITVNCTTGSQFTIDLGAGNNGVANTNTRRMSRTANGATDYLEYQLYTDAGHGTVWTTAGATGTMATAGAGQHAQTFQVYGRIPAHQDTLPTGTYTDSVVMTVNF